jgi:hypothetical protein
MPNLLSSYAILLICVEEVHHEGSSSDYVERGVRRFQESSAYVELDVAQAERGTFTIWVGGFNVFSRPTQEKEADYHHVGIGCALAAGPATPSLFGRYAPSARIGLQ